MASSAVDYYTPEMVQKLWADDWMTLMESGAWFSGEPMTHIEPAFQCYRPYACHSCKRCPLMKDVGALLICTNCRVIKYCSKDCQKSDWKHHKNWCKAFKALCQEGSLNHAVAYDSKQAWRDDLSVLIRQLLGKMGRFSHKSEFSIASCMPRCRKCLQAGFRINADSKKTEKVDLTACPRCAGVALCDDCMGDATIGAQSVHVDCDNPQNECNEHLLSLCCSGMIVEQGNPLGLPSETDCSEYWNPKDWIEYFDKKRNDFEVPGALFDLAPVPAFIADSHSLTLTLQHVLGLPEVSDFVPNANNLTRLVIHVVGATDDETSRPGRYVEMIRLNPSLVELEIHFIGPERKLVDIDRHFQMEKIRPNCKSKLHTHQGVYHEVMEAKKLQEPTIVICPHPGVHDPLYKDAWEPTMRYLVDKGYLLVLTGCNMRESQDDSELLRQWGAKVLLEPKCNPFRGLRPLPDPAREFGDYFYSNTSLAVFKGKE